MSLADKLTTLSTAKQSIKSALTSKGQDMSATPFTSYGDTINNLNIITPDYYVSTTGSNNNDGKTSNTPFLTLSKAVSTSSNGDIIKISAGTYTGGSNCDININKNVRIIGGEGVIFDGENTRRSGWGLPNIRSVYEPTNYYSIINGITFQNGLSSSNGGGLVVNKLNSIVNCNFLNNTATSKGGAITFLDSTDKGYNNIVNCVFNNNKSSFSGAINIELNSYNKIHNCTFINNISSNTDTNYGIIGLNGEGCVIDYCDFKDNTPIPLYVYNNRSGTVDNCYWGTDNPASSDWGTTMGSYTVTNNRTTANFPERLV